MIDRGIPREEYPVIYNGKKIGKVTSGGLSPILDCGIGMAFVIPETVTEENTVEIDIKGRLRKAKVVNWPFFDTTRYGARRGG